jgi:DNA-directed RNA polymerase specialized sigma24 family protein
MQDESQGSVTRYIADLRGGGRDAATPLWDRYFRRVRGLIRSRLERQGRIAADLDEEDAALSVFDDVFAGVERGDFPELSDRDDLWRLLVVIAARKASDLRKRQGRLKRGGGLNRVESTPDGDGDPLDHQPAEDAPADLAALMAEELEVRLDALNDETLRQVALLRLDGYQNDEIAARLGCARRTVIRKVELIRTAWGGDAGRPMATDAA